MINLAGVNKFARATRDGKDGMREDSEMASGHEKEIKILDPFCGSGTILTEAMLMGFRNLVGVDIAEKAVEDTKKNVGWMKDKFNLRDVTPEIIKGSAADLSELIGAESVDAIITEPFLGPQRGHVDLRKIKKELEDLYSQALGEFKKVLKKDGKIVMIWPVFHRGEEWVQLSPEIDGFKIVNPLKDAGGFINISKGLTNRGTLIYGREGQKVWREIVVLEK
jgi:tRNA G10  N-methylase Trm11